MKKIIRNFLSFFDIGIYSISKTNAQKRQYEQTVIEDERRKNKWLTDINFKTIIDVGANTGQFAQKMRKLFPGVMIYSFEPVPEAYETLIDTFKADNKFKAFNLALGDKELETVFYLNEFSPSSSFLEMNYLHTSNFPFTKRTKEINVSIKRLDDVFANCLIEYPLLIKLDVQGYESEVIKGGIATISKTDLLISEVSFYHLYEGQPLFDDIYAQLKNLGLHYAGNFDQLVSPQNGTVLQADAIFKKNDNYRA